MKRFHVTLLTLSMMFGYELTAKPVQKTPARTTRKAPAPASKTQTTISTQQIMQEHDDASFIEPIADLQQEQFVDELANQMIEQQAQASIAEHNEPVQLSDQGLASQQLSNQDTQALKLIGAMKESINLDKQANLQLATPKVAQQANQFKDQFKKYLDEYLTEFGQVYEKQGGFMNAYRNIYYIGSQGNQNLAITPNEYALLLETLQQASKHADWAKSISLELSVSKNNLIAKKDLKLNEIISAIKQVPLPANYSISNMLLGAAALTALTAGAYIAYQFSTNDDYTLFGYSPFAKKQAPEGAATMLMPDISAELETAQPTEPVISEEQANQNEQPESTDQTLLATSALAGAALLSDQEQTESTGQIESTENQSVEDMQNAQESAEPTKQPTTAELTDTAMAPENTENGSENIAITPPVQELRSAENSQTTSAPNSDSQEVQTDAAAEQEVTSDNQEQIVRQNKQAAQEMQRQQEIEQLLFAQHQTEQELQARQDAEQQTLQALGESQENLNTQTIIAQTALQEKALLQEKILALEQEKESAARNAEQIRIDAEHAIKNSAQTSKMTIEQTKELHATLLKSHLAQKEIIETQNKQIATMEKELKSIEKTYHTAEQAQQAAKSDTQLALKNAEQERADRIAIEKRNAELTQQLAAAGAVVADEDESGMSFGTKLALFGGAVGLANTQRGRQVLAKVANSNAMKPVQRAVDRQAGKIVANNPELQEIKAIYESSSNRVPLTDSQLIQGVYKAKIGEVVESGAGKVVRNSKHLKEVKKIYNDQGLPVTDLEVIQGATKGLPRALTIQPYELARVKDLTTEAINKGKLEVIKKDLPNFRQKIMNTKEDLQKLTEELNTQLKQGEYRSRNSTYSDKVKEQIKLKQELYDQERVLAEAEKLATPKHVIERYDIPLKTQETMDKLYKSGIENVTGASHLAQILKEDGKLAGKAYVQKTKQELMTMKQPSSPFLEMSEQFVV